MDYSRKLNWLFRPAKPKLKHSADVFFVYPTVSGHPGKKKHHNMNPYNPLWRFLALLFTVWRSRFVSCQCNLFAPHYRQTGIESLEMKLEEAMPSFEIAYADVRDAFLYYINNLNDGRPFILAGHSQGSAMLLELLKREFSDGRYKNRFVSAYLIGFSVTKSDLAKFPHIRLAKNDADTGSVISYNTSAKGLKLMRFVREGSVCVNPLNWKQTQEYAPKKTNLGFVVFDFGKRFKLEYKHFTGAYIDKKLGVIMIDKDAMNTLLNVKIGILNKLIMSRVSLHTLDIALFHRNLQKNVALRLQRFFKARGKAGRT